MQKRVTVFVTPVFCAASAVSVSYEALDEFEIFFLTRVYSVFGDSEPLHVLNCGRQGQGPGTRWRGHRPITAAFAAFPWSPARIDEVMLAPALHDYPANVAPVHISELAALQKLSQPGQPEIRAPVIPSKGAQGPVQQFIHGGSLRP